MSLIGWIIVGIVAGIIASRISSKTGALFLVDSIMGVAGALVAGTIYAVSASGSMVGIDPYSVCVAAGGAVLLLWAYHFYFPRAVKTSPKLRSRWSPRER